MGRMIVSTKLENAITAERSVIVKPYAENHGRTRHGLTRLMAVFSLTMVPRQRLEERSTHPEDPKCLHRGVLGTRLTLPTGVITRREDRDILATEPK